MICEEQKLIVFNLPTKCLNLNICKYVRLSYSPSFKMLHSKCRMGEKFINFPLLIIEKYIRVSACQKRKK